MSMQSIRLGDLRELLQGSAFSAWWTEWSRAAGMLAETRVRHEELLAQGELMSLRAELAQRAGVEAFSRAGEAEDAESRAAAEAQGLENRALELVGEYEEQRLRTSELWVRLGGAERARDERREGRGGKPRGQGDGALHAAEGQVEELRRRYEAEDRKRARLWDDVEGAWAESFERSLLGAEAGLVARRVRRDAERLFEEAEERRVRAKQLAADAEAAGRERREAERRRAALAAEARERFGCAAGEAFLYWRHADDKRSALAVALADQADGTSAVKALGVYTVGRQRGAASLEPAREGVAAAAGERDRLIEELLLGARDGTGGPPPTQGQ